MILVYLVLLCSCSISRKITTSSKSYKTEDINKDIVSVSKADSSRREQNFLLIDKETISDLEVVIVQYDTTKPIDSLTGRPPVFADIVIRDATKTILKTELNSDIDAKSNRRVETIDKTQKSTEVKTDINDKINTTTYPFWGIVALIIIVIYLICRFKY